MAAEDGTTRSHAELRKGLKRLTLLVPKWRPDRSSALRRTDDAILTIHPGRGTESQDWAAMLLRMYEDGGKAWLSNIHSDYLAGEEAGLKSVTVEIRGDILTVY